MANTSYTGLETAAALLASYASIAYSHKRMHDTDESFANVSSFMSGKPPTQSARWFQGTTFGMLIINASIIEGALRTLISEHLITEIQQLTETGVKQGRTTPSKSERVLQKYHTDLESQGGWEKLKEQYGFYFDETISSYLTKELAESIEVLFSLRNVIAHGTAIVYPAQKMDETMRDMYPFNWQQKLQRVSVYLQKEFGKSDVFENMAGYIVPEHFWTKTKELFDAIELKFSPLPERTNNIFLRVRNYSYGSRPM